MQVNLNSPFKRFRLGGGDVPNKEEPSQTEQSTLPSKVASIGSSKFATPTQLNAFKVELPKQGEPGYVSQIYKYRVDIWSISKRKAKDGEGTEEKFKDLNRPMRLDVPISQNRNVCFNVIEQVAQNIWKWKGKEFAYDRAQILYSSEKLCEPASKRTERIEVDSNDRLKILDMLFVGNPIAFKVEVEYVAHFTASNTDLETPQFLEILTSMKAYRDISEKSVGKPGRELSCFRHDFYFPERSSPFQSDPRILMHGINKSVKQVGDGAFQSELILQLDTKCSPFFPACSLIDFLKDLFDRKNGGGRGGFGRDQSRDRGRSSSYGGHGRSDSNSSRHSGRGGRYGVDRGRRDDDRDSRGSGGDNARILADYLKSRGGVEAANLHVKNVVVKTTHLGEKNKCFPIHSLTSQSFDRLTFMPKKEGKEIKTRHYFEDRYKIKANRDLPAVCHVMKNRNGENETNHYPMEVLTILPGQRVSIQKAQMEPSLGEIMTRQCQQLPSVMKQAIKRAKEDLYLCSSCIYMKHFGVRIAGDFVETKKALCLPPPTILYRENRQADLSRDVSWRLNGLQLRHGEHRNIKWCVVDVHNQLRQDVDRFMEQFNRSCTSLGVNLPRESQPPRFETRNPNCPSLGDFEMFFKDLKAENFNFVMFLSKNKTDDIHQHIKYCETLGYNICTQHVLYQSVRQAKTDTLNNIILKTNEKLGGSNQLPVPNIELTKYMDKIAHPAETLFIGLSFCGAGPMAFDSDENSSAGSAAIAYTIDKELRLEGNYWYYDMKPASNANAVAMGEAEKPESSDPQLVVNFKAAIMGFMKSTNVPPKQCYIYRAGTSDGELQRIKNADVGCFERAMAECHVKFPFVFLVTIRKSLNRLFKPQINEQDRAPQQNVRSGAVIVNELTHPRRTEFIMQSQKAIQGTGRPVRYVVVADTFYPRVPVETLYTVTHTLSYNHSIVPAPVSVCALLYAAKNLAERAQKVLNVAPGTSSKPASALSTQLKNGLSHRYWA